MDGYGGINLELVCLLGKRKEKSERENKTANKTDINADPIYKLRA